VVGENKEVIEGKDYPWNMEVLLQGRTSQQKPGLHNRGGMAQNFQESVSSLACVEYITDKGR